MCILHSPFVHEASWRIPMAAVPPLPARCMVLVHLSDPPSVVPLVWVLKLGKGGKLINLLSRGVLQGHFRGIPFPKLFWGRTAAPIFFHTLVRVQFSLLSADLSDKSAQLPYHYTLSSHLFFNVFISLTSSNDLKVCSLVLCVIHAANISEIHCQDPTPRGFMS